MDRTQHQVRDASLTSSKALPAADASATCDALDLGLRSGRGNFGEDLEFELEVPATPDLVDAKTIIFDVKMDTVEAMSSPTTIIDNLLTLTGDGGDGADATTVRFRVPSDVERYLAITATVLVGGGDNTGVDFTLRALL